LFLCTMAFQGRRLRFDGLGRPSHLLRSIKKLVAGCSENGVEIETSFIPKPKAMVGAACGQSIPLPAIASGFGLNANWL